MKKGQAAMEFLMTYGWSLFVVIAVIGALAYYGVLDPQQFLPEKCVLYSQIFCEDYKIESTGGGIIRLNNGHENDVQIINVTYTADTNQIYCENVSVTSLPVGVSSNFVLANDGRCSAQFLKPFEGSRIKGTLEINYLDEETMFTHSATGILSTHVEVGVVST